jgi:signal transduction histidine kinase
MQRRGAEHDVAAFVPKQECRCRDDADRSDRASHGGRGVSAPTTRAVSPRRASRWPFTVLSAVAGCIAAGGLAMVLMPADRPDPAAVPAVSVAPAAPHPTLPPPVILAAILGGMLGILAAVLVRLHGDRRDLAATLARTRRDHDAAIRALAERQDLETLGRLTAGVAHDMGNVMQVVETYLRAIPGAAGDPAETARLLDRARGAARRGANGARDLLALARGSSRRPRPVDVPSLLGELADVMQELLGEAFTVRLDVPATLPPALADPGDLEAMLVNLATNSRDAMAAAGSGALTISAALIGAPDSAEPDGTPPGGEWIRIDVVDTGIGMDAETLANAMQPFFTTKPRGRGTGLGLALAREFAERSGGMLRIESTPGVGTRASLFLHPVSQENLTDDAAAPGWDLALNAARNAAPPPGVMHIKG